jgi:hypothetical protein
MAEENVESNTPDDAPVSPKVVKKTVGLRSPREIALEKQVSRLEDRVNNVETVTQDITTWLGDVFPAGKPVKPSASPSPAPQSGLFDELSNLLGG